MDKTAINIKVIILHYNWHCFKDEVLGESLLMLYFMLQFSMQYSSTLSPKSCEIFVYKLLISATPRTVLVSKSFSVHSRKSKVSFSVC